PAFRAFTEGRFLAQRGRPDDRDRALALLEEATLLAPRFAPAYATFARLRLDFHQPPEETVAPAETAARRALALSPCLNEARLVLVDVGLYFRFDWARAKGDLDRALDCDPRDAEARRILAAYLAAHGRFDEALEAARQAQLLDPQSEAARADLAWFCFLARRYPEALDLARRTLDLQPEDLFTRQLVVEAALATGQPELALAAANALLAEVRRQGRTPLPTARVESLAAYWALLVQRRSTARIPVAPVDLALAVLHLGERERALRLVEESGRRRFGWSLAFLAVDPRFDPLRSEPRFRRVVRSLGLPDLASAEDEKEEEAGVPAS